jgi:hypothetical protein
VHPLLLDSLYLFPDMHPRARKSQVLGLLVAGSADFTYCSFAKVNFSLPFTTLEERFPRSIPVVAAISRTCWGQEESVNIKRLSDLCGDVDCIYEAVLGPGDTLYIPPLFAHHVETCGSEQCDSSDVTHPYSVSINVFARSKEQVLFDAILTMAIPFEVSLCFDC